MFVLSTYTIISLPRTPDCVTAENMSINVTPPFPKMGTLLDLQNGYIHLKDPKRVHCYTSGKQDENVYITRVLGKKREQ